MYCCLDRCVTYMDEGVHKSLRSSGSFRLDPSTTDPDVQPDFTYWLYLCTISHNFCTIFTQCLCLKCSREAVCYLEASQGGGLEAEFKSHSCVFWVTEEAVTQLCKHNNHYTKHRVCLQETTPLLTHSSALSH